MYFCQRKFTNISSTMFTRFNEVLQTAADVLAPPPPPIENFKYHWKQVKFFYANLEAQPKCHLNDTNIPYHLEEMLAILIVEGNKESTTTTTNVKEQEQKTTSEKIVDTELLENEESRYPCLYFLLGNRPLDLLTDLALADSPPGSRECVLNWTRRYLSCLRAAHMDQESIFQPIQKLIQLCNGTRATPYEKEEIAFLCTVSGMIRQEPFLINLYLPSHQHSAYVNNKIRANRKSKQSKMPVKNSLFDCSNKVEPSIRRISIVHAEATDGGAVAAAPSTTSTTVPVELGTISQTSEQDLINSAHSSRCTSKSSLTNDEAAKNDSKQISCDCDNEDRLMLLDTILTYFESPDNIVVVRACEGALVLSSLPLDNMPNCAAINNSLQAFSIKIGDRLAVLCHEIPEDMDAGDIEDCTVGWGLFPRDTDVPHFVGRSQLHEFLCWLDYSNSMAEECPALSELICDYTRKKLLEDVVEPAMLDMNAPFMLVLAAKIVRQLESRAYSEELANWLIGKMDDDNMCGNDCLLTILIENAQDNSDILLPTLQFIESLLDNANERILHGMLFRYLISRGYYDANVQTVQTWSDEEDERDKRRGSADTQFKSKTLAPSNILKVINHFLLLLPRQIMSETVGTCYEEYVQDASRHYQNWIYKTQRFNWPIEAITIDKSDQSQEEASVSPGSSMMTLVNNGAPPTASSFTKKEIQCNDSGISEETFYEGPLLKLLFNHVRAMATHPYELNLAVIAILSKLAFLPHPYLHEILLNPEIPITRGTHTLWSSMRHLAKQLLLEVPRIEGFQQKIAETGKRLLTNPPMISEKEVEEEECNPLFESLVVLEEFCKELAAIAFVKYHHATE